MKHINYKIWALTACAMAAVPSVYAQDTDTPTPASLVLNYTRINTTNGGESNAVVDSNTKLNFGAFHGEGTYKVRLYNPGDGALRGLSVETPEYITVQGMPNSLGGGSEVEVTLVMSGTPGFNEGTVKFSAGSNTASVNVVGWVLKDGAYFNDFEDNNLTGWYQPQSYGMWGTTKYEIINRNVNESRYALDYGKNDRGLQNEWNSSPEHYISTPKMKFDGTDGIAFLAGKLADSGENVKLVVKYSPDRYNWEELGTILVNNPENPDLQFSYGIADSPEKGGSYIMKYFSMPVPEGEYYIAFGAGNVVIDNFQGGKPVAVDYDIVAESLDCYDETTVNNPLSVSALYKNVGANDVNAADIKVELLENGVVVDEIVSEKDLASGSSTSYNFSYYAHKEGTAEVSVLLTIGSYTLETPVVEVTAKPESVSASYQIGEYTKDTSYGNYESDDNVPFSTFFYNSKSEIVYTAEDLAEVGAGSKITKISYPYYLETDVTREQVNVWLENTEDETANRSFTDTNTMTKVFTQDNYVIKAKGDSRTPEQMEFELQTPFEYEGKNLRVVVEALSPNKTGGFKRVYNFVDRTRSNPVYYKSKDDKADYDNPSNNPNSSTNIFPIINLYCEKSAEPVSGSVKDIDGRGIGNATVRAFSGPVYYEATTDSDGEWTMVIVQNDLDYEVYAVAEGFAQSEPVALEEGIEIILEELEVDGVTYIESNDGKVHYYDLNGIEVNPENLGRGIYIRINGKKAEKILR